MVAVLRGGVSSCVSVSWNHDPRRADRRGEAARKVGLLTLIPTVMVVGPVLGYFLGAWCEGRWDHAPWLSFGGMVLGAAASVRQILLLLRRAQEPSSGDGQDPPARPPES